MQLTIPRPKWFGMRGASARGVGGNFIAQNGTDFIVQQDGFNILTQDQ